MEKLTKVALKRPVAVAVCILALILFGLTSVTGFNMQLTPDMDMPVMLVMAVYPGAGPDDVADLVTEEIEDGCSSISGVDTVVSQSMENVCMVMFRFEYGTDMNEAYTDMQEAVNQVRNDLPDDVENPTIMRLDMNATDAVTLSVDSDSDIDLLSYVNDTVQDELEKISEVGEVTPNGGQEEYISVQLYPEYLKQYGLNIAGVAQAIASTNFTVPAGSTDYGNQKLNVSAKLEYETIPDLKNVPIRTLAGDVIHLSDIADVHYALADAEEYSRYDNSNNVSIGITKKQDANAITLSNNVQKTIDRLNRENPEVTISMIYDSSETIISSIRDVADTLVEAIILSMIVLFVFFGDIKASFIVGTSMPVSVLAAVILMKMQDFSLNMITMGGLVIGIGMMVDNSIVVTEQCFRKQDDGISYLDAAYEGTRLVIMSVVASTLTSVVVYLPLALLEGLAGQIFEQLGFTIIYLLCASLIAAITLVPLLYSRLKPIEKKDTHVSRFLKAVGEKYGKLLAKFLKVPKRVAVVAIIMMVASCGLVKFLNVNLMPSTDEGIVQVDMEFRPGLKLDSMDGTVRRMEEYVSEIPYIEHYLVNVSESDSTATVRGYVYDDCDMRTKEIVDIWQQELADFDKNCKLTVSSVSGMGMSGTEGDNQVEVDIEGDSLDALKEASEEMEQVITNIPGVLGVDSSMASTGSKIEFRIDPDKALQKGINMPDAASTLYLALSGNDILENVEIDGQDYTVTVEFGENEYPDANAVDNMSFTDARGNQVPLREIGELVYTDTPDTIERQDGSYRASVTATVPSTRKYEIKETINAAVNQMDFPQGVSKAASMQEDMMGDEFSALGGAIATAAFLVFMVMAIQFNSVRYSLLVMFCLPFSLIGAFGLLRIMNTTVTMPTLLGFLMLVGTVVNNGILYVDTTNLYRQSMSTVEALIETGKSRLRPILMTTLTTVLSMIPLARGKGRNGAMIQGMAVAVIGGLTASTILTLLLLPVFYLIIHQVSKRKKTRREKRREQRDHRGSDGAGGKTHKKKNL